MRSVLLKAAARHSLNLAWKWSRSAPPRAVGSRVGSSESGRIAGRLLRERSDQWGFMEERRACDTGCDGSPVGHTEWRLGAEDHREGIRPEWLGNASELGGRWLTLLSQQSPSNQSESCKLGARRSESESEFGMNLKTPSRDETFAGLLSAGEAFVRVRVAAGHRRSCWVCCTLKEQGAVLAWAINLNHLWSTYNTNDLLTQIMFSCKTYDLLIIYLWFTYDLLRIYSWFTYVLLMVYLWVHILLMICL